MRRIFWTQTLICLIFALWHSHLCDLANSGHFVFLGDLAKLAITIADIYRFYWNLVICMPFDDALLLRNFVKILHCLWQLWNCIQRFTFFPDTVYMPMYVEGNVSLCGTWKWHWQVRSCTILIICSFEQTMFSIHAHLLMNGLHSIVLRLKPTHVVWQSISASARPISQFIVICLAQPSTAWI